MRPVSEFMLDFSKKERKVFQIMLNVIARDEKMYNELRVMLQRAVNKLYLPSETQIQIPDGKKEKFVIDREGWINYEGIQVRCIWDDLNYGEGFMTFKNPFKMENKEMAKEWSFEEVMEVYNDDIQNMDYTNPCSRDYLEAEELALFNLILMCEPAAQELMGLRKMREDAQFNDDYYQQKDDRKAKKMAQTDAEVARMRKEHKKLKKQLKEAGVQNSDTSSSSSDENSDVEDGNPRNTKKTDRCQGSKTLDFKNVSRPLNKEKNSKTLQKRNSGQRDPPRGSQTPDLRPQIPRDSTMETTLKKDGWRQQDENSGEERENRLTNKASGTLNKEQSKVTQKKSRFAQLKNFDISTPNPEEINQNENPSLSKLKKLGVGKPPLGANKRRKASGKNPFLSAMKPGGMNNNISMTGLVKLLEMKEKAKENLLPWKYFEEFEEEDLYNILKKLFKTYLDELVLKHIEKREKEIELARHLDPENNTLQQSIVTRKNGQQKLKNFINPMKFESSLSKASRSSGSKFKFNVKKKNQRTPDHLRSHKPESSVHHSHQISGFSGNMTFKGQKIKHRRRLSLMEVQNEEDMLEYEGCTMPNVYFLYFVFKLIQMKLIENQVNTRTILNDDRTKLYLVLRCMEPMLMKQAEILELPKELELGFADILSLQPVDENLRFLIDKPKYFKELLKEERKKGDPKPVLIDGKVDTLSGIANIYDKIAALRSEAIRDHVIVLIKEHKRFLGELVGSFEMSSSLHQAAKIKQNELMSRRELNAFYTYIVVFRYWANKVKGYMTTKGLSHYYPFLIRLVHLKAIGDTGQGISLAQGIIKKVANIIYEDSPSMQTFWDQMNLSPLVPYSVYNSGDRYQSYFKTYQINEKGDRSIFSLKERVQLLFQFLHRLIDLEPLYDKRLILDISPLHDPFSLKGLRKFTLMKKIVDPSERDKAGDHLESLNNLDHLMGKLHQLMDYMSDEAMESDFINTSVAEACKFNLKNLWNFPVESFRQYFGDRLALYFLFMNFFNKNLMNVSIVIFLVNLWRQSSSGSGDKVQEGYALLIMSVIIVIWNNIFIQSWKRRERLYVITNGMNISEPKEEMRPIAEDDSGIIRRDLANSNKNHRTDKKSLKEYLQLLVTFSVTVALALGIFLMSLIILYLKFWLKEELKATDEVVIWVPMAVNAGLILLLKPIFSKLAMKMTQLETHKKRKDFQNSYIIKQTFFTFANYFGSFFAICFLKSNVNLDYLKQCYATRPNPRMNCYSELSTNGRILFIIKVGESFLNFFISQMVFLARYLNEDTENRDYDWGVVDKAIITESFKPNYRKNFDVDGIADDFISRIIEFGFLSLFGLSFPLGFPLVMAIGFIQIHMDKARFLYLLRRPIPTQAAGIGIFGSILELISYGSVVVNPGILVFNIKVFDEPPGTDNFDRQISHFAQLFLLFVALKKFLEYMYSGVPRNLRMVKERHENIIRTIFNNRKITSQIRLSRASLNMKLSDVDVDVLKIPLVVERPKKPGFMAMSEFDSQLTSSSSMQMGRLKANRSLSRQRLTTSKKNIKGKKTGVVLPQVFAPKKATLKLLDSNIEGDMAPVMECFESEPENFDEIKEENKEETDRKNKPSFEVSQVINEPNHIRNNQADVIDANGEEDRDEEGMQEEQAVAREPDESSSSAVNRKQRSSDKKSD